MGYVGYSMSERARDAYSDGLVPLSKITKEHIDALGLNMPVFIFKGFCVHFGTSEWHHTSMHYNKTYFYNIKDVASQIKALTKQERELIVNKIRLEKAAKESASVKGYYAVLTYEEWSGSKRFGKWVTYTSEVYIIENTAYVLGTSGKKQINGTHILKIENKGSRLPSGFNKQKRDFTFSKHTKLKNL